MSQIWDIDLISPTGTAPSADIQRIIDGFNTLRSVFSGAAEPAVADRVAYMLWADTTTGLLKIRNAANTAWITVGTLASTNLGLLALAGGQMTGGVNEAKSTVASATTPTIFATTTGNVIDYTGTATCTGFTAAPVAGVRRTLVCAAACAFTAGANMLIDGFISGQTYTATAGDQVHVVAFTTTLFRLTIARVGGSLNYAVKNLLPNTNWQLMSTNTTGTKMNVEGTGTEAAVSFTSFTPSSSTPTFLTTNTQRLVVGDRVQISGLGDLSLSGMIVTAVVTNTSFTLKLPLGALSPATTTGTASPIGNGDIAGNTTGASGVGWNKSVPLVSWVDDFSANRVAGAKRMMGFRKTAAGTQTHYWNASTRSGTDMKEFAGMTMTFGAWVAQKVKGGAGTFKLTLNDGVSTTNSANGAGNGSFEFLSVTKTISVNATDVIATLSLDGGVGDIYYLGLPTLVFGAALESNQLGPPLNEVLFAGHWNPPILTPLAGAFPATAYPGTGGLLFGYSGQDMEAMSYGVCHHTVKAARCKIELVTATAGKMLFTGSTLDGQLAFGPQQVTQVATIMNVCWGILPFDENGKFAVFTAAASTVITNATFDFDIVYL